MKLKVYALVLTLFINANFLFSAPSASAITFGCKKAQSEATSYLKSAYSSQNREIKYLKQGMYQPAFSSFQYAHKWYTEWKRIVSKSPKCFVKDNYVKRVKASFKGYEYNLTMASRYGVEIAKRYNYGSPDPCFKYLGDDNAYLECSMSYSENEP